MTIRTIATLVFASTVLLVTQSCNRGIQPGVLRFSHFWSEPAQRVLMDTLLAGFHREHPEIPVEVSELSWSDGKTKLMVGFNSETAPDVLELGSDWVAQFSASGVLLRLDSVQAISNGEETDHAIMDRFAHAPAYCLESGMWRSHYFAVPWLLDTRVLFMNDSLVGNFADVSEAPANWFMLKESCAEIERRFPDVKGIGVNGPDQHRLYKKFLPYVWSNGGDLFDTLGRPTMDRPENVEALRFYVDQLNFGQMGTQKDLDDAFVRGKLAYWFSGSWLLPRLAKVKFRWSAMTFPGNRGWLAGGPDENKIGRPWLFAGHEDSVHDRLPGGNGESFAGGEYLAINAHSSMKREAKLFLEYITRPSNELAFARKVNEYPADTASQNDTFYLNRPQGWTFTGQLKDARMTPVIPQWLDVEAIIEDEVSKALYHKETPEQAMASMQKRTVERMKEP